MQTSKAQKGSAILLLLLVLVVAGAAGFYYFKVLNKPLSLPQVAQTQKTKPLTLTLTSPADNTLSYNNNVVIKGKTLPNTTVVFYTDKDQNSITSDATGNFEGNIALAYGINNLTVTAFAENGEEKSLILDVVNDNQTVTQ